MYSYSNNDLLSDNKIINTEKYKIVDFYEINNKEIVIKYHFKGRS